MFKVNRTATNNRLIVPIWTGFQSCCGPGLTRLSIPIWSTIQILLISVIDEKGAFRVTKQYKTDVQPDTVTSYSSYKTKIHN